MQIGRGNDGFARAEGIGKSAGNHLSLVFIGRDVNVSRADYLHQLFRALEPVAKNYVGLDSQVFGEVLQRSPVLVTVAPQDMRVGYAGDHVDDVFVARQDFGQGLDDVFYDLVGREQSKREQNVFAFGSEGIFIEIGVRESEVRDAMWN